MDIFKSLDTAIGQAIVCDTDNNYTFFFTYISMIIYITNAYNLSAFNFYFYKENIYCLGKLGALRDKLQKNWFAQQSSLDSFFGE